MPENPARVLTFSGRQLDLLFRSLLFSSLVALAATALGTALAMVLLSNAAGRRVLTFILPPLVIVPPSIHGLNWTTFILTTGERLGRHGLTATMPSGWSAAALVEVLSLLPLAVGIAWAGFAALDGSLLEAGLVYRPAPFVLMRIAVWLVSPVLWAGAGVMFLLSLSDYAVPSLFSVNVYALEIFSSYSAGFHPAAALFTSVPLVGVIIVTLIAGLSTGRRAHAMALSRRTSSRPEDGIRLPPALTWAAVALLLTHVFLPLAVMAATVHSWGFIMLAASNARSEMVVSLAIAVSTAALCMVFGLALGCALDSGGVGSAVWWVLTCLAFALPAPLIGIGILQVAGGLGSWAEDWLPVWANVARFLPIAAFVSYSLYRRLDRGLLEAAHIFGPSRTSVFMRVSLPLMVPGLAVSAAACFSLAMGELGATLLVAAPGRATLIMRLYNLLHYGASREVAALCLLVALPALAAGALMTIILSRRAGLNL
jgi:iron(III) transport system permease protein